MSINEEHELYIDGWRKGATGKEPEAFRSPTQAYYDGWKSGYEAHKAAKAASKVLYPTREAYRKKTTDTPLA